MMRKFLLLSPALFAASTVFGVSDTPASASTRIGLATEKLSPVQLAAYDPLVYRAQVALTRKGFDVGSPDGLYGARTRAGIQAYQRANNLPVTGQVSENLVAHLEGASVPRDDRAERRQERREDRREVRNLSYSELVAETQAELSRLGYDLTFVRGGRLNGETRDAIADYQRRHNLEPTGIPTPQLLLQMRRDDTRIGDRSWRDRRNDWRDDNADQDLRYVTRLSDDFNDGDFSRNTSWRVLSGNWSVASGILMSNVPIRVGGSQSPFPPVFGQIEQRLGISPPANGELAAISTTRAIDNSFRVSMMVGGRGQAPASLNFGPYLGADANSGYRLVYDGESTRPLKLMVSSANGGLQTVATGAPSANLFDGRMHTVEWIRGMDGHMVVTVDGSQALSGSDSSFRQDFDGFSVINGGGSWGIDAVTVQNVTR